jgi:hypothetical protein
MSFKLLGGGSDLNTVVNDMNSNILQLKNNETTEFFNDANGIRRVLLGQGANSFYGLKVSQPNIDVYTALDNQLIFNSNQNTFKIVNKFSASFTVTSGSSSAASTTFSINHGLGYTPLYFSTVNITTNTVSAGQVGLFPMPFGTIGGGSTAQPLIGYLSLVSPYISNTSSISFNATVSVGSNTFAGTVTAYILQETAT